MSILVSASTNPPKTLQQMYEYIKKLNDTDVDFIHCDVMDGKFVKSRTFGSKIVKEINKLSQKKLDVHLMVKHPTFSLKRYIRAGADILTVHYEAYKNKQKLIKILQKIRAMGAFAGLSFNPDTPVEEVLPFIYYCDMFLVMSVVPGKSGQQFISQTIDRLTQINKFLKDQNLQIQIEVDGGVNTQNIDSLKQLDVNSVVVGSYLYNSNDYNKAIK
ncbi:MAG: ribulose-phosphate 3-epimerase, partial [Clostridia bacterium]|nr:ribulose-phosphate 3-epimerase [Clostridia bacterium]